MNRYAIFAWCFSVFLGIFLGGCKPNGAPTAQDTKKTGSIYFERPITDLGQVPADIAQPVILVFRNASGNSVSIKEVVPSCSCTRTEIVTKAAIPTGGTGSIQLLYVPTPGDATSRVLVKLSNGDEIVTGIKSFGVKDAYFESEQCPLGIVSQETGAIGWGQILGDRRSNQGMKVTVDSTSVPWLSAIVTNVPTESAIPVGNSPYVPLAKVQVQIKAMAPRGTFTEFVRVAVTDEKGSRLLSLRCQGEVRPEIDFSPPKLILLGNQPNQSSKIYVRSIQFPFRIMSAQSKTVVGKFEHNIEAGFSAVINVQPRDDAAATQSVMELEIDHPHIRHVSIPVIIMKAGSSESK